MSAEDFAQARRMHRPTWRDPRLGVGVLLVAGSVAVGIWAVQDAAETVPVYAAAGTLTPGTVLSTDDLTVHDVRIDDDGLYLSPGSWPEGAVITRTVGTGELVPQAAVGAADAVDVQPVVVDLGLTLPADLSPGTAVDLWWVAQARTLTGTEEPGPDPELLASDLVVAAVLEDDSMLTTTSQASVELLVPRQTVATVLAALSTDGRLVAVPTLGGADRTVAPSAVADPGGPK